MGLVRVGPPLVRVGPPRELILQLQEQYQLRNFIETGTYYGATAVWAASHFAHVVTIERSKELYEATRSRLSRIANITFICDDSSSAIRKLAPGLAVPSVFWLDAHWSRGDTWKGAEECPLLGEIQAIHESPYTHFLFIDDARLLVSPPPEPHRIEDWPRIDEVIAALGSGKKEYYIVIIEDGIIAVPPYARSTVANYCRELEKRGMRQGYRLVVEGLRLIRHGLLARF